jgi:hypothetical protein
VYASVDTRANIISFADLEDIYEITYKKGKSFTVHHPDRDLLYHGKKSLYVADFSNLLQDRKSFLVKMHTKVKEACARVAYELVHCSRYPLLQETIPTTISWRKHYESNSF